MDGGNGHAVTELLGAGQAALERGAWEDAHAAFAAALAHEETPEALEGLGMAAMWLEDATATIAARERAFYLYRAWDDRRGAARVATCLAEDYLTFRGEAAVANGWLRRAARLLEGLDPSPEHGLLACTGGYFALIHRHDAAAAQRYSAEAVTCARALGLLDIEMLGLALDGLALVAKGAVTEGMARLDEATTAATSGEMRDPGAIGTTCCYLIYACEWVRDYDRAAQWCDRLKVFCERWRFGSLLAVCRTHYAAVLTWRGAWSEAEAQLAAATQELVCMRPAMAGEGIVRLAELRRRQGRWEEADELFAQAARHPLAPLGRASLALDRGDAAGAVDWAQRFVRHLPAENRTERVAALEVLVRAAVVRGDDDEARRVLAELQQIAADLGTAPLTAAVAAAQGVIAGAGGDHDSARRWFEDAVDLYERVGAPFEAACTRLDIARSLRACGRAAAAEHEIRVAAGTFEQLGAPRQADRARVLLRELQRGGRPPVGALAEAAGLTARELEVLSLLARGLSNQEIATTLVLSIRTVERHISTIYDKLGVRGRIARTVAATYALRHGLPETDSLTR